ARPLSGTNWGWAKQTKQIRPPGEVSLPYVPRRMFGNPERERISARTPLEIQRELDNPFWSSLANRHADIAQGGTLARRYPAAISPIAGLPGVGPDNMAALEA